jgi:anti-anti-sigma factor
MRYQIIEQKNHLLIKLSGDTGNNESLLVKKWLSPYLERKKPTVIVDLGNLNEIEPVALLGVLSSIKKQMALSNGSMRLRSLSPAVMSYFTENRLQRMFEVETQQLRDEKEK